MGHRRKPNQRVQLPASVKGVLRKPSDELSWVKLEGVRKAVVAEALCERLFHLSTEELEKLGESIRTNKSRQRKFNDEVGSFERGDGLDPIPKGSRVMVAAGEKDLLERTQDEVLDALGRYKEFEPLRIRLRPLLTKRAPPLDDFGRLLCTSKEDVESIAASEKLSQSECLDRLLIVLWDALFLTMSEAWTTKKVANLHRCEAPELARYFILGLHVGSKPLFDGICAMCACLLHGNLQQHGSNSNKYAGPPSDRDGNIISNASAQPPFLLRYSPQLFQAEAPAWFVHDPDTNRLSLKPGVAKPWARQPHPCFQASDNRRWLYCIDCKERYFPDSGERAVTSHITYRDRASTNFLKPAFHKRYQGTSKKQRDDENQPQAQDHEQEQAAAHQRDADADSDVEVGAGVDADASGRTGAIEREGVMDMDEGEDDGQRRTRFAQRGYVPNLPDAPVQRPTLTEYQERWDAALAKHSRGVPGAFSRDNLVPEAVHQLWQDAPHIPFSKLRSVEAQARLSTCRPHSALEEPNMRGGVGRYAHLTGDAQYRRRAPQQLNSMMGFVLNQRNGGRFMGLTQEETDALHEVLSWGRQPGNNRTLEFYGTLYESFQQACETMMGKFQGCIPEGSLQARIRATKRETSTPERAGEDTIGHTLADEAVGMVIVDPSGHPMKYDGLTVLENVIGTQHCRIEVDVPGPGGKGWQRTSGSINTAELGEAVRKDISQGSAHILEQAYVPASDAHYDARVWPVVHPYGSGSVFAEPRSGGVQKHARNRLTLIQSWFRRSPLWGFWALNRLLYSTLFFKNLVRRRGGVKTASSASDPDPFTRHFGTAQPSSIPESTEWWKRQQKELFAITDDAECGIMQAMVTISHNDGCAEQLAAIRRGPGAYPEEEEYIEYLLSRKRRSQERPPCEFYAFEHVLSYQRRVSATKSLFMRRGSITPLGCIRDWWDRTDRWRY